MSLGKVVRIGLSIAALLAAMSFKTPRVDTFNIYIENMIGNIPLKLDSATYKNDLSQPYTVSKLKYYIGNIHLKSKNGQEYISDEYFLINEEDPASKHISLQHVPEGEYSQMSFTLGVDSIHNCSGAQTGALDPANGMFWAWNTGYVFFKMEGNSPASKSSGNMLEFHIGGYKASYNCIRTITLAFKSLSAGDSLSLIADLSKLFKGHTVVDFSKTSSVTDFHGATAIADNYSNMFTILQE